MSQRRATAPEGARFGPPNTVSSLPLLAQGFYPRPLGPHNSVVTQVKETEPQPNLAKYAWLSIATAFLTIALKAGAYAMTGSVGLLSDAAESLVNLVAAVVALVALTLVAKPADSRFTYGRSKVEYFSASIEGSMIFIAATFIVYSAIKRIIDPVPLENLGIGLVISVIAAALNGLVGVILLRAGAAHRSPTLKADGTHLLTDVVTSVGVVIGVALVAITHWSVLDPIVALLVGANIIFAGWRLLRSSIAGLLDITLPAEQNEAIKAVLAAHASQDITFHGLQTRQSGRDSFANVDMQVPGSWSVKQGHELAEDIASQLCEAVPGLHAIIHVEPIEDPRSYDDIPDGYVPL